MTINPIPHFQCSIKGESHTMHCESLDGEVLALGEGLYTVLNAIEGLKSDHKSFMKATFPDSSAKAFECPLYPLLGSIFPQLKAVT